MSWDISEYGKVGLLFQKISCHESYGVGADTIACVHCGTHDVCIAYRIDLSLLQPQPEDGQSSYH